MGQRVTNDGVGFPTLDVDDEPDAARVVFEPRVVQALGLRSARGWPAAVACFYSPVARHWSMDTTRLLQFQSGQTCILLT